jgi:hypothetical protein
LRVSLHKRPNSGGWRRGVSIEISIQILPEHGTIWKFEKWFGVEFIDSICKFLSTKSIRDSNEKALRFYIPWRVPGLQHAISVDPGPLSTFGPSTREPKGLRSPMAIGEWLTNCFVRWHQQIRTRQLVRQELLVQLRIGRTYCDA